MKHMLIEFENDKEFEKAFDILIKGEFTGIGINTIWINEDQYENLILNKIKFKRLK